MTNITYLFSFIVFFISQVSYSQRIENVDFVVKNNIIIVSYDLADCNAKQLYDLKLKVVCDGENITPKSISGDLNKISCGNHKKIEWDVLNDNMELKGNTQVIVTISKTYSTKITGGPSNAFLSMLLPGLGDHYINKESKSWYYISLIYLGSAIYAYSAKTQSDNYYSQYHQAKTQPEMDAAYKSANDNYQTFQLLAGLTAAVWTTDVIYVAIRGFKNRKEQLNRFAVKEPLTKFYIVGTSNCFKIGVIKKF